MAAITQYQAIPIQNFERSPEAPKSVFVRFDFSVDTRFEVNFSQMREQTKLQSIRTLYADLSGCVNDVILTVQSTRQSITLKAGKQYYMPVLVGTDMQMLVEGGGTDIFRANFLNVDMDYSKLSPDSDDTGYVISFNGRQGVVVPLVADYSAFYVLKTGDTMTGPLTITQVGNSTSLTVENTSVTSTALMVRFQASGNIPAGSTAPAMNFGTYRTAPAANDSLATINIRANNSAISDQIFASITSRALAVTAGAHSGQFTFNARVAGSNVEIAKFDGVTGIQAFNNVLVNPAGGIVRRALTFATLPAAAGVPGAQYDITDSAAAPAFNAVAAGGGAVRVGVKSTGVAWVYG